MLDNLTDEQIDEAAFRMAMADTRDGLNVDLATDGVDFAWTPRRMRIRKAVREFSEAVLDDAPATALTPAWEASRDAAEGQVTS